MATSRRRVAGLAATAISLPLLFPTAASANARFGQSEEPVRPPAPGACAGYLWKNTSGTVLSKDNPRIVIPGLVKQAGIIDVTEVINYDLRKVEVPNGTKDEPAIAEVELDKVITPARRPKPPAAERYEKMRIEFWKGSTMLGATSYSPDLLDDGVASWVTTPLGRVDIFEDADRVEIVHASQFMATDGAPDAFIPVSVCITWQEHYTANSASLTKSCDSATITLTNDGTAKGYLRVIANGVTTDYLVKPYGGTQTHHIALAEDAWADVKVIDLADGTVLFEKKWLTDCVPTAPTTTLKDEVTAVVAPPTIVEPQVLGIVENAAPQAAPAPAQLARTGSQTGTNATIGASLLAAGLGLVTFGRRRREVQA